MKVNTRVILLWAGFVAGTTCAQQQTASIGGTVTDQQNAVVAGARVQVVNVQTGAVFHTRSNQRGLYAAPGLSVGTYEVRVEREGFKQAVRRGLTLQVNQNASIDIVLEIGEIVQRVEVLAETPLVDAREASLGQVIENRRVRDLPLNGRQALALSLLTAGVIGNSGPTASGFADRGVQLTDISINGGPNGMNAQMLDGNNNTLSYMGEVGVPPSVDAVEEFKVQSGTMSAEFGFTAGGAINLVTKSGTNQVRGSVYYFVRNDKFDARNTFSSRNLPLRYNQYGGSLGGPFVKNKFFGFLNLEQYRLRQSSPRIATVPIQEWRNGDFSDLRDAGGRLITIFDPATARPNPRGSGLVRDPLPNNTVSRSRWDPITPKIVAFWPMPNSTPINRFTQSQNYRDSSSHEVDWTQYHAKSDYRFHERNSMFLRYTQATHDLFDDSIFIDPTVGPNRRDLQTNRNAMVSDTHTFSPTFINDLRVGVSRQFFTFRAVNGGHQWPRKLGLPSVVPDGQFPAVNFGFGAIGGQSFGTRASLNWDIQDMATRITGPHMLKIGANLRLRYANNDQPTAMSGSYTFSGLTQNPQSTQGTGYDMAQFLLGAVTSSSITRTIGTASYGKALSFFLQDEWKAARRLTLNLGLRWDYQQKMVERNDGQINLDLNGTDPTTGLRGVVVFAGRNGQPRSFVDEDYNDFGPRFGFAYDLFGNGRSVIRGGYGIFYPDTFNYYYVTGSGQLFTSTATTYTAQTPGDAAHRFADGFPYPPSEPQGAAAGPGALLGQSASVYERFKATPLTQAWNLSIQTPFENWLVDLAYAGNKGNHLAARTYNLNQVHPAIREELGQKLFDRVSNPCSGLVTGGLGSATTTRERTLMEFPCYNGVGVASPRYGNYLSHQFQLTVKRRFANGLLLNLAYTAGKRISDSSNTPAEAWLEAGRGHLDFQNPKYDRRSQRSVDPQDVAQRAAVSGIYELPFGPGRKWNPEGMILRKLAAGWQLNVIGIMQTGLPLVVRGASNNQADRPDSTGQSAKLDNPTRERWFNTDAFVNPRPFTFGNVGRALPDVRSPGTVNWDLSIIKSATVRERVTIQFRAEAFNFLNNVNLTAPATTFSPGADGRNASATFATITSARDARIVQFGLKVLF